MVFQKLSNEQKQQINSFLEKNGKEKAAIYRALVMRGVDSKAAEKTALTRTMGSGPPAATSSAPSNQQAQIPPKNDTKKKRGKKEEVIQDVDMVKAPAVPKPKAKGKVLKDKFEKNQETTVEMVL